MKNTKEIIPVLTAVYCINQTSKHGDIDIKNLLSYLFINCFDVNVNMLTLTCLPYTKKTIMPQLNELLDEETKYLKYLEEIKK